MLCVHSGDLSKEGRGRAAERPGGAEVATAANISCTRRSAKVKVLGET